MSVPNDTLLSENVKIPWKTQEERSSWKNYLNETGRKAGPYFRILAIEAMSHTEKSSSEASHD
jgi:hypothetical protein